MGLLSHMAISSPVMEETQRKNALFEHWYSTHMALGWCMRYPCPALGCLKLFCLSRNLDSHLQASAAAAETDGAKKIFIAHVGIDKKVARKYLQDTCAQM